MKMRAFYKPLKQMLEPDQIESINFDTKVLGVYMEMDGKGYHKLRMSDFEIMWGSGVHDDTEDQSELFAGDIAEVEYEGQKHTCKVEYCGCGYLLAADSLPDGFLWLSELVDFDGKFCWAEGTEKVGNIYDNPDLLEGEKV